jgi:hypothetical protein
MRGAAPNIPESIMKALYLLFVVGIVGFTRIAAAQSITGEWNALMSTPGGARPSKIVFKQDGEKLSGTVKREAGDVPLQGTIKGAAVQFSYTVEYNGNALVLAVAATVTGNSMKGTVSFGGQAEDEWTATRAAAPTGDASASSRNSQLMRVGGRQRR